MANLVNQCSVVMQSEVYIWVALQANLVHTSLDIGVSSLMCAEAEHNLVSASLYTTDYKYIFYPVGTSTWFASYAKLDRTGVIGLKGPRILA